MLRSLVERDEYTGRVGAGEFRVLVRVAREVIEEVLVAVCVAEALRVLVLLIIVHAGQANLEEVALIP